MTPDRPLRIAIVSASPFPCNHGTPAGLLETALALQRQGHQVHVVTYPFGDGEAPPGVHIVRTPALGFRKRIVVGPTWDKPLLDLLVTFVLIRLILAEKIDVVHGSNYEGALIGFVARLVTGRPLVYHAVNTMTDELPSYGFIRPRFLARWLATALDYFVPRTANLVIAISSDLTQQLEALGISRDRIRTIPLGIDLAPFDVEADPGFRERKRIGEAPTVIYTGLLDAFQRIDYLLRAMRIVVDSVPDAQLLLVVNVATEADIERCRALTAQLGLEDHVKLFLNTPFREVPGFLEISDVAVVSRPECPGFPIKLLNYMAAAKPIVVFEGSAKGLENGHDAILAEDHDFRALAAGIVQLLADRELAARLGEKARLRVETHYAWPAIASEIVQTYLDARNARRTRDPGSKTHGIDASSTGKIT
jgi:glycosyltransferase involved in cell wall biosynthesis